MIREIKFFYLLEREESESKKVIKCRIFDIFYEKRTVICRIKISFLRKVFIILIENIFFHTTGHEQKITSINNLIEEVIEKMEEFIVYKPEFYTQLLENSIKFKNPINFGGKKYFKYYPCVISETKIFEPRIKKYVKLKILKFSEINKGNLYDYELGKGYFEENIFQDIPFACDMYSWNFIKNKALIDDKNVKVCKSCYDMFKNGIIKNDTMPHSFMNIKCIRENYQKFYIKIYQNFNTVNILTNFEIHENRNIFNIKVLGKKRSTKVRIFDKVYEKNYCYFKMKLDFINKYIIVFSNRGLSGKSFSRNIKEIIRNFITKYFGDIDLLAKEKKDETGKVYFYGTITQHNLLENVFNDKDKILKILSKIGENFSNIIEYESKKSCMESLNLEDENLNTKELYFDNKYCPFYVLNTDISYFFSMTSEHNKRFLCKKCFDFFCLNKRNFSVYYQNPHTLIYYFSVVKFIELVQ